MRVRNGMAAFAVAALLVGASGCAVGNSGGNAGGTTAPSVNPTAANTPNRVDQTKLPDGWPQEASTPKGMSIVSVTKAASGTTVMGTVKADDPVGTGQALKADWEKNGVLISEARDTKNLYSMAGLTKDGKTQLSATISPGSDGTQSVILTTAPAAK